MKKKIITILGVLFGIGAAIVGSMSTGVDPVTSTISAVVSNVDEIAEAVAVVSADSQDVVAPSGGVIIEDEPESKVGKAVKILNATADIVEVFNEKKAGEPRARDSPIKE